MVEQPVKARKAARAKARRSFMRFVHIAMCSGKPLVITGIPFQNINAVIGHERLQSDPQPAHIVDARSPPRPGFGMRNRRQQKDRENGNDGNHGQQFHQGKPRFEIVSHTVWTALRRTSHAAWQPRGFPIKFSMKLAVCGYALAVS